MIRKRRNRVRAFIGAGLLLTAALLLTSCGGADYSDYAGKYSMLSFSPGGALQYSDFLYSEIVLRANGEYEYSYCLTNAAAERVQEKEIAKEASEKGKYRIGASKDTITFEGIILKGEQTLREMRFEVKGLFSQEGAVSLFAKVDAAAHA